MCLRNSTYTTADCDTDNYLVAAKVRERWAYFIWRDLIARN
jgi:hypothetical protein